MKIIGNAKKDYFDYLIHSFGKDDLAILDRRPIGEFKLSYNNNNPKEGYYANIPVDAKLLPPITRSAQCIILKRVSTIEDWVVINGISYPLVRTGYDTFVVATDKNSTKSAYSWYRRNQTATNTTENMITLSKLANRHCFIISNGEILGTMPNLTDLHVPSIIDQYTMYQETANFIANTLNFKDINTVKQTDKEKIIGHGFDFKSSFRGK